MGTVFWIRRFLTVFAIAFVVIGGAQFLRGRTISDSMIQGLIWSTISSAIFTASRTYHAHRGHHCALCRDTPEMLAQRPPDRPN